MGFLGKSVVALAVLAGVGLSITTVSTVATAEDTRPTIKVPAEVRTDFLAEMRAHMGTLDEIVSAFADGDFATAADLADVRLDFGHKLWEGLIDSGMSMEEVRALKRKMADKGLSPGLGSNDPGAFHARMAAEMPEVMTTFQNAGVKPGSGVGRYMTPEFRAMGGVFHQAGTALADAARAASDPPTAEDYAAVMAALNEVTSTCWSCHEAFRVE